MSGEPSFELYGAAHLGALGVTLALSILFVKHARRHREFSRWAPRVLAGFLFSLYPIHLGLQIWEGSLNREIALPCHLCDVAAFLGGIGLLTRHQRIVELVWFWGLAGTFQGLLTPTLRFTFPSFYYFAFFALHSGVVITAVYLVAGLGIRPQRGAVWRAFGWIQVYLVIVSLVNWVAGTNYGFLRAKPPQATLLDFMGPWPWYIVVLEALGLGLFTLLYLPFWKFPGQAAGEGRIDNR